RRTDPRLMFAAWLAPSPATCRGRLGLVLDLGERRPTLHRVNRVLRAVLIPVRFGRSDEDLVVAGRRMPSPRLYAAARRDHREGDPPVVGMVLERLRGTQRVGLVVQRFGLRQLAAVVSDDSPEVRLGDAGGLHDLELHCTYPSAPADPRRY